MNLVRSLLPLLKDKLSIDRLLFNQGVLHSNAFRCKSITRLSDASFSVYSQWGEDGIIQFLINNISISSKTFIEFGVEDFFESNCRFLLEFNNWSGFVIDGSSKNIKRINAHPIHWKYDLRAHHAFVTQENICEILALSGFQREPGIISIDIDGNDWHVLSALTAWRPSIFIIEYNNIFGEQPWSIPYNPSFARQRHSLYNIFYGAGLNAFRLLLEERGYTLVGTNANNSNAFFVRRDLLPDSLESLEPSPDCHVTRFAEARQNGRLTYRSLSSYTNLLNGEPVFDALTRSLIAYDSTLV
jgi:hypothetical protein